VTQPVDGEQLLDSCAAALARLADAVSAVAVPLREGRVSDAEAAWPELVAAHTQAKTWGLGYLAEHGPD
jgi:hypothetical protein